ncbi:DUF5333 domain-containing protein [Roseovarius sp. MMSF_3305]|nr:DUF5333 domain-containing protein [Roseovarius sp. MMSF_3305]
MRILSTLALSIALAATSVGASAQSGLYNEKDINDGLLIIAVADKIRRGCDSISARIFKARSYAVGLKELASSRGYSDEEIDNYIENKENKAEMRLRRNAYFQSKGASNLDPESLCVLGRAEIQKQSQIGALLRAR